MAGKFAVSLLLMFPLLAGAGVRDELAALDAAKRTFRPGYLPDRNPPYHHKA